MKDSLPTGCPSTERLAECLEPLAPDDARLLHHLESCDACRQTLDGLAGAETWWDDAQRALSCSLPAATSRIVESVCALSVGDGPSALDDPLQQHEVAQLEKLLEPASHPELLGRIGRYELAQLVGRGGMGLVFRAHDTELHRIVAVKTLAVHLIPVGAARTRFIREARASASLVHPHIVPVHDVITDGAVPALVMQYVAGPTLDRWLAERGPLPWLQMLQIGVQLADALAAAHENGLVHRDIKPGNVLLEADGSRALLTDFGLVRALDDATLTRSGTLAGTPDYMSPEQARGGTVGPSSDLFSLGATLYTALTGHPPFRAADPMAVMNRICHDRQRSVGDLHPDVPVEISKLLDNLLSKEPRRRLASAAELRDRLLELGRAKRHLTTEHMRIRKRWGAIAAVLLGCVALFQAATWARHVWHGSIRNPAGGQPAGTMVTDPGAAAAYGNGAVEDRIGSAGFVELQQLDRQLSQTRKDTEKLLESNGPPEWPQLLEQPSPWNDIQVELQRLDSDLRRLENRLKTR